MLRLTGWCIALRQPNRGTVRRHTVWTGAWHSAATSVLIPTADNKPMQRLLARLGYAYCGLIDLEEGRGERLAFQKRQE